MRKSKIALISLPLALITACSSINSGVTTLLKKPASTLNFHFTDSKERDDFQSFVDGELTAFSKTFATCYLNGKKDNALCSPVSLFFALSLLSECTASVGHEEILETLNLTQKEIRSYANTLYKVSQREITDEGNKIACREDITNSIWLQKGQTFVEKTLDTLANDYFCYSYETDYANANKQANQSIRDFIKEKTRGLIDQDFNLSPDTLLSLINTLYIKDIWSQYSDDLQLAENGRLFDFTNADSSVTSTALLQGYYADGQVFVGDNYQTFYTNTSHGYRLQFYMPNVGTSIQELIDDNVIYEPHDYQPKVVEGDTTYLHHTNVLFPAFEIGDDADLIPIVKKMGINSIFSAITADFSPITDSKGAAVSAIRQVTKLKADKKGIEGAAVTITAISTSVAPDETIVDVYHHFPIERNFIFTLSDSYGVPLFAGVVNQL